MIYRVTVTENVYCKQNGIEFAGTQVHTSVGVS